jgi:hypothetical protein
VINGAAGMATLTITTTAPTTATLVHPPQPGSRWLPAGGAVLACIFLFGIPAHRRRWQSMFAMLTLLVFLAGGVFACGGGGGTISGGGTSSSSGTTAGNYVVKVTGTSGSSTASGTFTVNVL